MEIAGLLVVAGVVLVAGIRIGMLVAPRITRWADRADKEPNDD
jgi:hypothetical protein